MIDIPKVSVVVPIYNVEKYLRQCVDSILAQTLKDIEVILVNDGSPDDCASIIEEYTRADARVRAISQPNGGYGRAVNHGLDVASGEYVGIVEPDDWIEPDMYEKLYAIARQHEVQIAKGSFYIYTAWAGDKAVKPLPAQYLDKVIDPKRDATPAFYTHPSIWAAIYKRSFLTENHIRCSENPGASYQDNGFNFKALIMAERMWFMSAPLVHYRCDNPTQSSVSKDKVFCIVDVWNDVDEYLDDYPELKAGSYSLREHLKLQTYSWNISRVVRGEEKERFRRHFCDTFEAAMMNGAYDRDYFDSKTWRRIQTALYPRSVRVRLGKVLHKMTSWLWKERLEENTVLGYYLFRVIRVAGKTLKRPTYNG